MSDHSTQQRSGLQKIRDIALTVMAILVSILSLVLLYVIFAAGSALSDLGKNLGDSTTPAPAITFDVPTQPAIPTNSAGEECIGEVEIPGC
jgi:hypothetical protein